MLARSTLLVALPTLVAVAALGYLIGRPDAVSTDEASTPLGTLAYSESSGWRRAARPDSLEGLPLVQPFALAPAGETARAGLLVGELASGAAPLPPSLLDRLSRAPTAEVLYLLSTQAYRYRHVEASGEVMTLYVIPSSAANETVLACYVSSGGSSGAETTLRECERIANTFSPLTSGSAQDLAPNVAYARQVAAQVDRVDRLLGSLRPEIRLGAPPGVVAQLANRLAGGIAKSASTLAALQPPAPAGREQAALVAALRATSSAYAALATAVGPPSASAASYSAARGRIYSAEAGVDEALRDLRLLGYGEPASAG